MRVAPLTSTEMSDIPSADLLGGKGAGLAALIRLGERVPAGFVVTTTAYREGIVPRAEIAAAYAALGSPEVAVRSSATAEDLPDASFAGQQATVLGARGTDEVCAAIEKCWASLHDEPVRAYRAARGIGGDLAMAVVVQTMVDPDVAGVMFTADPVTGRRDRIVVDAAPGLGTTVVDGTAPVDHYTAGEPHPGGCLTAARVTELATAGARLQTALGAPQDVEWAYDRDGTLWLLQSRPITTLFPAPPPAAGEQRIYLEFGHVQGMLRPVTPMGMATLRDQVSDMLAGLGVRAEVVGIGGRLYGDVTDLVRSRTARKRLVKLLAVDFGPRAQAVMTRVLADPEFAPDDRRVTAPGSLRTAGRAVSGILRALADPDQAKRRVDAAVDGLRRGADTDGEDLSWPIVAGMLAAAVPEQLLSGIAREGEIATVLGGMPHNVTIAMDLALWQVAVAARPHRELLLSTPPAELAARWRAGTLPEFGMAEFLDAYGHRGVAEVDLGVPRWDEDPAPVFAMLANHLRLTDSDQAPDRRYAAAARAAEAALADLSGRTRWSARGRLGVLLLRRARRLAGLRESGKFAGLYELRRRRAALLSRGATLVAEGRMDHPDDIMFLTPEEADRAVPPPDSPTGPAIAPAGSSSPADTQRLPSADAGGAVDLHALVAARRAVHVREMRRRTVPVALLSDGTDLETIYLPEVSDFSGGITGVGASAGRVTGPARVVLDPAGAHVEPGEILVVATTDPGWTPLFLTAGGLVCETGAIMAHGPTVAREYGIPAVIGVAGATTRIVTGQVITVDGAAGTITLDPA